MILLIDNYDSFTYNLYQYIGEMTEDILVKRNDEITLDEIETLAPSAIVISPGPGYPASAGITIDAIRRFAPKIPILGVCLGHQAIGEAFGGRVVRAKELVHGKATMISLNNTAPLFMGLPSRLSVARYHSLIVNSGSLPDELKVIAMTDSDEIMAIAHRKYPVYGVQFHPESIMTKFGKRILRNFIVNVAKLPVKPQENEDVLIPAADRNVLKPFIQKVIDSSDLTAAEAETAMEGIMDGAATDAQIGSFLTALRMKGETVDEITGFARAMRKKAASVKSSGAIDIVGTGGDRSNTFNISTTAAFVAAGAGLTVAKHGNRSVSSRCGSADVLEALGVNISISPAQAEECLEKIQLAFMFAPGFHKSMKYAASPRREIGVRSVFNILGPLSNPASAEYMLLGVYEEALLETMAKVLQNLSVKSAVVAYGSGLDEITTAGTTKLCEIRGGKLIKYEITPAEFGMDKVDKSELVGGTAKENAQIALDILGGQKGAKRDVVVLNAAAAIYAAKKADSIAEGITLAEASIDSGAALRKLVELKELTKSFEG